MRGPWGSAGLDRCHLAPQKARSCFSLFLAFRLHKACLLAVALPLLPSLLAALGFCSRFRLLGVGLWGLALPLHLVTRWHSSAARSGAGGLAPVKARIGHADRLAPCADSASPRCWLPVLPLAVGGAGARTAPRLLNGYKTVIDGKKVDKSFKNQLFALICASV